MSTCRKSTFENSINVYSGTCHGGNFGGYGLMCIGADAGSCGLGSAVSWTAEDGVEYKILVHSRSEEMGEFTLDMSWVWFPLSLEMRQNKITSITAFSK